MMKVFLLGSMFLIITLPKGYRHCLKPGLLTLPSETHTGNVVKVLRRSYRINAHTVEEIKNYLRDEQDENKCFGLLII